MPRSPLVPCCLPTIRNIEGRRLLRPLYGGDGLKQSGTGLSRFTFYCQ